jgi:peptidoglycan/xylan/chitin deacetylase (PgdA/CDA1 family)
MKKFIATLLSIYLSFALYASTHPEMVAADADYPTKGSVSITFDDAVLSTYTVALPILSAKGLSATEYVNTGYVGKPGYMTWSQIQNLQNTYKWDIGSHSVTHPLMTTINDTQLKYEVAQSKKDLLDHGIKNPVSFATPYGDYNNNVIAAIAREYQSHRPFHDRSWDNEYPYNKYLIYVQSVESNTTMAQVKSWIDHAKSTNTWLVLVFHEVTNSKPEDQYDAPSSLLKQIADYIKSSGIRNAPVSEMLAYNKANMIGNSTFVQGISEEWSTDNAEYVKTNSDSNGAYPESKYSARLVGNTKANHIFSQKKNVTSNATYLIQGFMNLDKFTAGEVGYYIDEYDMNGTWISGQWMAGYPGTAKDVFESSYVYKPTSSNVATMMLEVYMNAASKGTVYVDSIEMYKLMEVAASPTPAATPAVTPSLSPTPTATPSASPSPSASASATPRPSISPTPIVTSTPKPSATSTPTPTVTATPRPSVTPTIVPTSTPIPSVTPSPVNMVLNSGFNLGSNGWALNWQRDSVVSVLWDANTAGCAGPHSIKFESNNTIGVHLYSDLISIDPSKSYIWETCVKTGTGAGEFGYYIDEYGVGDQWINGQWKGSESAGNSTTRKIDYTPVNSLVKKIRLQYYKNPGTMFTVFVDEVKLNLK